MLCAVGLRIVADHDAHGVGAVAVAIVGGVRVGAGGVVPVVVVLAFRATAIGTVQGWMRPVHAGIHVGDDDAFAGDVQFIPDARGSDESEVPRDRRGCGRRRRGDEGIGQATHVVGADALHLGPFRHCFQRLHVAGDDDGIDDPERLHGIHVTGGLQFAQQGAQSLLAALGSGLERFHHSLAAG